ncbi:hypothetical protein HCU40_19450 (plasmid) [Pseudanabaena biceps]|nr:hypothetical protein [Pseudanabaena biceps]
MIKAIFTALTGITEDIDSDEYQTEWERRRYADDNDLDNDDIESDETDDDDDSTRNKGWFGLW